MRVRNYIGRLPYGATVAERLWVKVDQSAGPDGCWPFLGRRDGCGYGQMFVAGRGVRAHRVAWEVANLGPIPEGLKVLHKCDNPPCCNPRHLLVGTQLQNIADRVLKGRTRVGMGERHAFARLTDADVVRIRELCAAGLPQIRMARMLGVTRSAVGSVVRRKTWKHVA